MFKTLLTISRVPFVRDVTTMQMGRLVTIGCSFLASILYVRYLELGGYGDYAVVLAYTGTVGLLINLGQQATTMTFFAEAYGRNDRVGQARVFHYYLVTSIVAATLLVLLAIASPAITEWIYGKSSVGSLSRLVFLSSICELPFIFISIVLQTVREIRLLTILENAKTMTQLVVAVTFLSVGLGVTGLLMSSLAAAALFSLISLFLSLRIWRRYGLPSIGEAMHTGKTSHFWRYAKEGFWMAIDKSLGNLYPNIFLFVFSIQASPAVVGLLRLGMKLADLPSSFALASISRLTSSVIPTMVGKGGAPLRKTILRLVKHTVAFHVTISVAAALIVPPLLPLVYGTAFKPAIFPFLVILILNLSLAFHAIATPILRISSQIHIAAYLNAIATAVGIGLFFGLENVMRPLWTLYVALAVYHVIIALTFIPVVKTLKHKIHTAEFSH